MPEQHYPEPTVGALILNSQGRILLTRSHKWRDRYVVPGGHVELGECLEDALRREVKEETALDIRDVEFLMYQEFIFDDAFWKKRHYIFFDFICRVDSIEVVLNSEAEEYVWVLPEEALQLPLEPYTVRSVQEYLRRGRKEKAEPHGYADHGFASRMQKTGNREQKTEGREQGMME